VEGRGGDLEAQGGQDHQASQDEGLGRVGQGVIARGDLAEEGRAHGPEDQADAIQHHCGRDRTRDEILQARLGRAPMVPVPGGHQVERQRDDLEGHEEGQKLACRDRQHQPQHHEGDQGDEVSGILPLGVHRIDREEQDQRARQASQGPEDHRQGVGQEDSAPQRQGRAACGGVQPVRDGGQGSGQKAQDGNRGLGPGVRFAAQVQAHHQEGRGSHHHLRGQGLQHRQRVCHDGLSFRSVRVGASAGIRKPGARGSPAGPAW